MYWQSWNDFFAMGGYGLYVWGSVVVMFGTLVIEVAMLAARRKVARVQLQRWIRNTRRDGNEDKA